MMAGLFDRVKQTVRIREYIEAETGIQAKRAGGGSWRLNPCPFCGHNDCFTVNDQDEFYKCFSCQAGGDVIEFEQAHKKLVSPLEAAKSIAKKRGIPTDDDLPSSHPPITPPEPTSQKEPDPVKYPDMDTARACEVRELAAKYYHGRLMASREGLAYQMDVRRHSKEIVERLMVGMGGGNLIAGMKREGVTVEELTAVGLVQSGKAGYRAVVANGVVVYPHFSQGKVLFFTLKDPEKKKKWQLKKDCAPSDWICYGQDALEQEDPVIIVEGENDRLSVVDLGGYRQCVATIATYNEPAILDRLKGIAKGRIWYLCFDNDPPVPGKGEGAGARYTRQYANVLLGAGGDVRVIQIEAGKDGGKADIDDVLRAAEKPEEILKGLMEGALKVTEPIKAPAGGGPPGSGGVGPGPGGDMPPDYDPYKFKGFEVLGELKDERVLFWSRVNERLYSVTLKDFNLDKLVQIGGQEVAARVSRALSTYSPGQVLFADVKKRVIVEAGKRQLWDPEYLGQGLHGLEDKLLVVVGGRAWTWDGKELSEWRHPVIDGRLIDWRQGYDWVDMKQVIEILKTMDAGKANKILDELIGMIFQWGFTGRMDMWLITGWYMAQFLQSMWAWRPHLWLTGTAGSGKTLMNEWMGAVGGRLALRCEGQTLTEPGLRQSIGCDSVLVLIDEIEKSQKRDEIIYYIRSAGRGGVTRKGSSSQKAVSAQLKHMVFLSSIERGVYRAAENGRYLPVETKKSTECHPNLPNTKEAAEIRAKITAYAIWASFRAKDLVANVGKIGESDPRFVESLSVAFAMIAVSFKDPAGTLVKLLTEYLEGWAERFQGGVVEDEAKLVEDIMMAQVRLPEEADGELRANGYESTKTNYVTRTVSQLIETRDDMANEARKTLEANGIKLLEGKGLFLHPDTIVKALLRQTQWAGLNIRDMLLRIVGAESKQLRLGGSPLRGVVVPWSVVGM